MPRIYIKSNTNILQRFDKNYSIPVGATALGKFRSNDDEDLEPLADEKKLSPGGAVFGLLGWLTTRKKRLSLSEKDDASPAAEVAADFLKANDLAMPEDGWEKILVHPKNKKNGTR